MKQNDKESTVLLILSCEDKCSSTLTVLTSQKQKLMIVERLSKGQLFIRRPIPDNAKVIVRLILILNSYA